MSDEAAHHRLLYANICVERISRALRQLNRLQRAHAAFAEAKEQNELPSGPAPEWYNKHQTLVDDHIYFAVVAVNHALKATKVLRKLGDDVPDIRQDAELAAWRDIEEHWDDPVVAGKPIRAMKRWQAQSSEGEPGLSYASRGHRLVDISGVNLRKLRTDLKALRQAAGQASEREWGGTWLTETQAAQALGLSVEDFRGQAGQLMRVDFGDDLGVRYQRDAVNALATGGVGGLVTWYQDNGLMSR